MSRRDTGRRAIGVNFDENGAAKVLLWAPEVNQVELLLPGKDRSIPLICKEMGYWAAETTDLKPGDLYYFELDGKRQLPDPASLSQPDGVHGASQALDIRSFEWDEENWINIH